ncbi:MAG: SDR family oxidoreductase [Chloroflexi bacterium]|nr:SDR family oxidoreductase [Chloroflexota bacterium]
MGSDYVSQLFRVEGQVVVITGGGGVLCGAIARGLARAGAKVVLLNRTRASAERVAETIRALGGEVMVVEANVLDRPALERTAEEILARYGRVDALINGAGGNRPEGTTGPDNPFTDMPERAIRDVFDLNFMGTFLPCQVYARIMAQQGKGTIINIASVNAFKPLTKIPAYSAAKGAVANFTQWLAAHLSFEYSPNIRVNAIAPGFYLTRQNRYLLIDETTGEFTERAKNVLAHTPMGRFGDPDELIGTVIWLLSPAASFVHGATIVVDGGFVAYGGV